MSFLYATGLTDGLFEGCGAWLTPGGGCEITTSALEEQAAKKSGLPLHVFQTRDESTARIEGTAPRTQEDRRQRFELTYAAFLRLKRLASKKHDSSTSPTRS